MTSKTEEFKTYALEITGDRREGKGKYSAELPRVVTRINNLVAREDLADHVESLRASYSANKVEIRCTEAVLAKVAAVRGVAAVTPVFSDVAHRPVLNSRFTSGRKLKSK